MQFEIQTLTPQKLVGHSRTMSMADDETRPLFQGFMPKRNSIPGRANEWVYDLRVYPQNLDFADFRPTTEFTKWAAVAVGEDHQAQDEFDSIVVPGGLYACFFHRGPAADAPRVFGYIFQQWLPASGYSLDDRPHFEVLQEGYDPLSPDAEEQIWVPIKSN